MVNPERIESKQQYITPSTEWAWMMGVIAGGGCITPKGRMIFTNPNPELREAIRYRGEALFCRNATSETFSDPKRSPRVGFGHKEIALELGNFVRDQYVSTIPERHSWILQNEMYIHAFLEGIFETRGRIYKNRGNRFPSIKISAARPSEISFLTGLLGRIGVKEMDVITSSHNKSGLSGLNISSLRDISLFAGSIHSVTPKKEEYLAYCRTLNPEMEKHRPYTTEEILTEWTRLTAILGHSPTVFEIKQMKKFGITPYNPQVYTKLPRGLRVALSHEEIQKARELYELRRRENRKQRRMPKIYSDTDIIQDWITARRLLGHKPNSSELVTLKKERKIRFSVPTFTSRFGRKQSFGDACEVLEAITVKQGEPVLPTRTPTPNYKVSVPELVAEWQRITKELGRIPSYTDLRRLKEKREAKYAPSTYVKRFSYSSKKLSFREARNVLIALTGSSM